MIRRLFTILGGLSLVLCVASAGLWVSVWMGDGLILKAHIGDGYLV